MGGVVLERRECVMRNLGRISLETSESGRTDAVAHWKSIDGPQPLIDFITPVSLTIYFIDGSLFLSLLLNSIAIRRYLSYVDPLEETFRLKA